MRRVPLQILCGLWLAQAGPVLRAAGDEAIIDATPSLPPTVGSAANVAAHQTPVDFFRGLLMMDPTERDRALADRPERNRQVLLAKLEEYEAMPPVQRELRLRVSELHWWLVPLLQLAPSGRSEQLARIPEPDRSIVQQRLRAWDQFTDEERQEVLDNRRTIVFGRQLASQSAATRTNLLSRLTLGQRERFEHDLSRFASLPSARRQHLLDNFAKFFDLSEAEQARTLNYLSEEEQEQMQTTLDAFQQLPPRQRSLCIRSFEQLARMSPEERNQFLKNADLWQKMSPADRETWRKLVTQLPPLPPPALPPMPPGSERARTSQPTNPPRPPPGP